MSFWYGIMLYEDGGLINSSYGEELLQAVEGVQRDRPTQAADCHSAIDRLAVTMMVGYGKTGLLLEQVVTTAAHRYKVFMYRDDDPILAVYSMKYFTTVWYIKNR